MVSDLKEIEKQVEKTNLLLKGIKLDRLIEDVIVANTTYLFENLKKLIDTVPLESSIKKKYLQDLKERNEKEQLLFPAALKFVTDNLKRAIKEELTLEEIQDLALHYFFELQIQTSINYFSNSLYDKIGRKFSYFYERYDSYSISNVTTFLSKLMSEPTFLLLETLRELQVFILTFPSLAEIRDNSFVKEKAFFANLEKFDLFKTKILKGLFGAPAYVNLKIVLKNIGKDTFEIYHDSYDKELASELSRTSNSYNSIYSWKVKAYHEIGIGTDYESEEEESKKKSYSGIKPTVLYNTLSAYLESVIPVLTETQLTGNTLKDYIFHERLKLKNKNRYVFLMSCVNPEGTCNYYTSLFSQSWLFGSYFLNSEEPLSLAYQRKLTNKFHVILASRENNRKALDFENSLICSPVGYIKFYAAKADD